MGIKKFVKKLGKEVEKGVKTAGKDAKKAGKIVVGPVAPSAKDLEKQ